MVVYAAVEGGGTTFRAALAEGTPDNITDRAEFETTTPDETLAAVKAWLDERTCRAGGRGGGAGRVSRGPPRAAAPPAAAQP